MSRISSLPSGMGMHHCKTPEGLRLCNSLSIRMKDLALLARRRAWAQFEGRIPRIIQSRYWMRQSREVGASSTSIASASSAEVVPKSMSMGSTSSAGGFPPEGPADEGPSSAGSMNSAQGLVMSRAKMFGGTVVHPDAILASSSASSLYLHGTWLSSSPSNLSSRRRTTLQYASIFGSWQLDSFI